MLKGLGYDPGRVDGYFDKNTERALKKFQSDQGIRADGELDAKTAEKLESKLIELIRDPKNDAQLNRALEEIRKEITQAASKP